MLKSLQIKIIAGIAAAVVSVGGVAAAVVITNQNAVETSVGGVEGNTLDVADGGSANQQAAGGNEENTAGGNTETGATEKTHEHAYTEEIAVEATCETDGKKTFTCECGDSYKEIITATDHVFNYVYNEDATYEADGTETAKCAKCGITDTRTAEGTMLTYTYTDMNVTMYAKQSVNVRELPLTDGERVGGLSTNQEITVTGQCNETGWYRIEYDGGTAYVSNNYLSDTKVEVAAPAQAASGGASTSTAPKASDYPVGEWVDMGSWSFIITNDWVRPSGVKGIMGIHLNDGSGKWCWLRYDTLTDEIKQFHDANICHCTEVTHGGTKPLWDNERGVYYFP